MSNLLIITNKIEALGIWDSIPSDSINSVVIEFEFAEDWKNLLCVAQFTQGEKTYNVVIENNRCVLPTELKIGNVMLSVFGTKTDGTPFRETSIPFCFEIYDAGFSSTAETPIPPTPDLYEQLIDKFAHSSGVAALNGKTGNIDIVADEGISVDDTETGKIKIKNTAKVTVDAEISDTSENPVQNKVVKGYVDNVASDISNEVAKKLDTINGGTVSGNVEFTGDVIVQNAPTAPKSAVNKEYADSLKTVIDSEISDTSENPVQNKVVKGYVDNVKTAVDKTLEEGMAELNAAITNANTAAEGAGKVNISAEQTPTGADITVTDRTGAATTVHIDTLTAVNTWEDIKNAVRLGLGEKLFPVGYEFTTLDADTTQNIIWVVRAHNHHTAANNKLTHTMTLETKNVYSLSSGVQKAVQYDAIEAFYFAELGLAAGTYNITIANQAWYTADNGKTFQFELTKALPVGGQLVFAMTYNATLEGKSVKSYANKTTTTALETVTLTEGSEGTSLGTTNGSSPNVNHMHRAIFGSNNYAQSAVRQWLNSAAVAGSVWTPTNVFDRPASWATSYNGFMHGLPADFLAVVQPAVLACLTNSLFEVESLDGAAFAINQLYSLKADKFFLLSRPEIFGDWDSASYKDGTQLEYYNGLTATERIKRDAAGTARNAWLRSPYPSFANIARIVDSSGEVYIYGADNGYGVAPACIIA